MGAPTIIRYRLAGDLNGPAGARSFTLQTSLNFLECGDQPRKLEYPFIWTTWPTPGNPLPLDATQLLRDLGLTGWKWEPTVAPAECRPAGHETLRFPVGAGAQPIDNGLYYLRLPVETRSQQTCRPTVLDAGIAAAWMPVSLTFADPWGMTRNLVTAERRFPELLVRSEDYVDARPRVHRASGLISRIRPNYMAGRYPISDL